MKPDNELNQLLAKMLPEQLEWYDQNPFYHHYLGWKATTIPVLDTELLHICWLIEQTLTAELFSEYTKVGFELFEDEIDNILKMNWQQRTIALAKAKGLI